MKSKTKSKAIKSVEKMDDSVLLSTTLSVIATVVPGASLAEPLFKMVLLALSKKLKGKQSIVEKNNAALETEIDNCLNDTYALLLQTKDGKKAYSIDGDIEKQIITLLEAFKQKDQSEWQTDDAILFGNQLRDIIGNERFVKLQTEFSSAFRSCLFHYPVLNATFNAAQVDELYNNVFPVIDFVGNEFLHKVGILSNKDGMMRCFYYLFANYLITQKIPSNIGKYLARVQDEYNDEYIRYNSYARGKQSNADGLSNMLISSENISVKKISDPLINAYMQFIHADCMFFQGHYPAAVNGYEIVLDKIKKLYSKSVEAIIDQADTYLRNSIGWSYHLNANNRKALEYYNVLFAEKEFSGAYPFIWRYRRNYGVCLENDRQYLNAVAQYQMAINSLPEDTNEYKVYITYCSALMKHWDIICGKLQGNWLKQTINIMENEEGIFCVESIDKIKAYLSIAQKRVNTFSDLYVQQVKVLTYELLLSKEKGITQIKSKILRELFVLDTVAPKKDGNLFVKRDFYYALYLIEEQKDKKSEWLDMCKKINAEINGRGDSGEFETMINKSLS